MYCVFNFKFSVSRYDALVWNVGYKSTIMVRSWQAKLQTTRRVVNLLHGGNSTEAHFRDLRNRVD